MAYQIYHYFGFSFAEAFWKSDAPYRLETFLNPK